MTDAARGGRVLVVGSLNADLVVRTAALPGPGQTVSGSELRVLPGGKSANQAVAAALLGADVALIGAVGADAHGDLLLAAAAGRGVDVSGVRRAPEATGTAVITVDDQGENTIIVSPGANGSLAPGDAPDAAIAAARVVVLALEVPMATVIEVARRAAEAGATVVLNPSPWAPIPAELLAAVDVLVLNEHELAALVPGAQPGRWPDVRAALTAAGVGPCVVTLGAAGAMVLAGAPVAVPPVPVRAVDTTGCGDAFTGALAAALARGESLEDAARAGARAGAFAATRVGAQTSYPTAEELVAFVADEG